MIPGYDPLLAVIALLLCSFALFALGVPISFAMGGTATLFGILFFTRAQWYQLVLTMYGTTMSLVLIAVPMFIFMGSLLVYTNMTEDLYDTIYKWAGPVRGVLASGTEMVGAAFAAMCGSAAASIATMGQIALPEMLKRGYHPRLAHNHSPHRAGSHFRHCQ
jgi:TRAP-type mannitol/chloroaromatic compound transport system permease large subunit